MTHKREAVWLFAGGPMQQAMAAAIRRRGWALVVSDADAQCFLRDRCDCFVHADTFDVAAALDHCDAVCAQFDVKAVVTAAADCHQTVARVARHLGLPGIDPDIADACRFKHRTRRILTDAGVLQPRFAVARSWEEARQAAQDIGYPVAVKATDNSGSRGFSAVSCADDFDEAVFTRAVGAGTTGAVLVEELLRPAADMVVEQSVETLWYGGSMYWLNWVDRIFSTDVERFGVLARIGCAVDKRGVEVGHVNPAHHPPERKRAVWALMETAGRALGMHRLGGGHVLKGDVFWTPDGPVLVEVTPRLSGGWDSSGTTLVRGGDFCGGVLALAAGEPLTVDLWHRCFSLRYAEVVGAVVAAVPQDARDCIGRTFFLGSGLSVDAALEAAVGCLEKGCSNVPVEQ